MAWFLDAVRNSWRDDRGVVAVFTVLMLPVLIGALALAVDIGFWYVTNRSAQNAADAAAIAGAHEILNDNAGRVETAALSGALANGFSAADGDTITVNNPPTSGTYSGDDSAVEAVVSRKPELFFATIFITDPPLVAARAVAQVVNRGDTACLVALESSAKDAFEIKGNAEVTATSCQVQVNSTDEKALNADGNAVLNADGICVVGGYDGDEDNFSTTPETQCTQFSDPLAGLEARSLDGLTEFEKTKVKKDTTLTPGIYDGGIEVTAGATVTFEAGLYVLRDGGIELKGNASLAGDGVTFYLTGDDAKLDFTGGSEVQLSAATTGDLAGILFFQDRDAEEGLEHKFTGGADMQMEGVLYFSTQDVEFKGNASGEGTAPLTVIARRFEFTGSSSFNFSADYSGSSVPARDELNKPIVTLVE